MLSSAKLRQFFVEDDNILDEQGKQASGIPPPWAGSGDNSRSNRDRSEILSKKRRVELKPHPYNFS
jgi:hypothetical protein